NSDTQESCVPGLFAAGECAAGINGANRLGGNSLSDLLVFGQRAGEYAAKYARDHGMPNLDLGQAQEGERWALAPFERPAGGDNPFQIQQELQDKMQEWVGIVRTEVEMQQGLDMIHRLWERVNKASVSGNRWYNPGWHTVMDLHNLLTVSE